jgi:predicted AAA+ superfamily ATPase
MWFNRYYENDFFSRYVKKGKVLVLYGPRRTGKTSLINKVLTDFHEKVYTGSGDDFLLREILSSDDIHRITQSFKGYSLVIIDEAQRILNVGYGLKIITDHLTEVGVIATGSSSFELSNRVGEPLTGRNTVLTLYPLSVMELVQQEGRMAVINQLNDLLIFGMYPEVLTAENHNDKISYLINIRNSYLLRDILELENLRNSSKIADLLKLLAFQVGSEVSLNELSNSLGIAKKTVERYLDLLSKAFIIRKIGGYSRNLRNEVTKTARYYFYDNGIRNAMINNFNDMNTRMDHGMLWENFCVSERLKVQEYRRNYSNNYFWRTYEGHEVDLVEESAGRLEGYEFKWKEGKSGKSANRWLSTYPEANYATITPKNFLEFMGVE